MSNIRVELQLEDGSFTSGILRAGQSLSEFKKELQRTDPHFRKLASNGREGFLQFKRQEEQAQSLTKRLRDLSIIAGGVSLAFHALSGASSSTIGNLVRINSEMEKLRYQMAGMSEVADPMADAAESVAELQRFASSAPFSLGALSNSFVKLKAAGIDPMNGSLRALTNGLAAFGASDEQLNRVTIALTQMQGKGVVSMEELRQQLGESMPSAMRLMARSMGVSVGELSKLVSSGMVESKAALTKWFQEVELSYGGMAELMMRTFSGQMAKIQTGLQKLVTGGEMGSAFEKLKENMEGFSEYLSTQDAKEFFDLMGQGFQLLINVGQSVVSMLRNIKDVVIALGPVIPVALGGAVAIAAAVRMLRAIDGIKASYISLRTSAQQTSLAIRNLSAGAAIGAISAAGTVRTAANAAAAAAMAAQARGASAATQSLAGAVAGSGNKILAPLIAAGSRFLGLLGPIAFGLSVLVPVAWEVGKGIHSWWTGAEKAKEEMESAVDAAVRLKREQQATELDFIDKQIAETEGRIERYVNDYGKDNQGFLNELESLWNRRRAAEKRHEEELTSLVEDQNEERFNIVKKRVAEEGRLSSRNYDMAMNESARVYERELAEAAKNGTPVREVQEAYKQRTVELRAKRMGEMIGLWDKEILVMRKAADEGEAVHGQLALAIEERIRLQEQLEGMTPENLTVELLTAPEDESAKSERLQRYFNTSREKVEELTAELNGASGAVAKLAFQIRRGDFGNFENATEELQKMMNLLLETTIQAEALDGAFKALNNVEKTIDDIVLNMREEIVKNAAIADGIDIDDPKAFYDYQKEKSIGIFEDIGSTGEETWKNFTKKVTDGVDLTLVSVQKLGESIRTDAFGDQSIVRIDAVNSALQRVLSTTSGINSALLGINFGNLGMPGGSFGMPLVRGNVDGGILDLIAGPESGGDYNSTLDNGRWTGGPRNLTGMTLNEIRDLQRFMLSHEENRNLYRLNGKPTGSSALGRYQIVGSTLEGLIRQMGLTGDELFDEDMQDRMALELVRQTGGSPSAIRSTWEGLKGYTDQSISDALMRSMSGPTKANAALLDSNVAAPPGVIEAIDGSMARIESKEDTADLLQPQLIASREAAARAEFLKEIEAGTAALRNESGELEKYGAMGSRARKAAEEGKFGTDSEVIADILARADALDAETKALKERDQANKEVKTNETKLEEQLVEIEQRRADALARAKDPNYKGKSDELRKIVLLEAEHLALIEKAEGGKNNDRYREAQARFAAQRASLVGAESAEALEELTRAADEATKRAITNERELRSNAFAERVRELEALRDQAIRDGALVAEANKQFNRAVAAERRALDEENKTALQSTIDQMKNLGKNINEGSASWAQSLSDNIYDVISGQTTSFRSFANAIRESIARSMSDAAAAFLMKPFESLIAGNGAAGSGIGGLIEKMLGLNNEGGIMASITGSLSKVFSGIGKWISSIFSKTGMVGVKHTGGIVGSSGGWGRSAPVSAFLGAPKFHTGGIVSGGASNLRKGLMPSEVPIIAQKGEGVFTREQMAHLGGTVMNSPITISAPITVNGSAGTPEQNNDLAKQMARESEAMFRNLIRDEMNRQMRPGGMMR